MRLVLGLMALLVLAACKPAQEPAAPVVEAPPPAPVAAEAPPPPAPDADPRAAWDNRLGNLPPDAAAVIGRVDACTHFSGEFNGDRSERDREVAAKMTELRCDTVDADATAVRAMYGDRPDVMEALDMATEGTR